MFRLICLVGLLLSLSPATSAVNLLSGPEGIVYDSLYNRWLVSNWFGGSIVQIDPDGTQSFFRTGLNHPSGVHIKDATLYVSCNNEMMAGLSLADGSTVFEVSMVSSGLHAIASDTSGFLYACDWASGRVIRVDPTTGDYSTFAAGIYRASGIVFDAAQNRMIVCSWGGNDDIQAVALPDGEVTTVVTVPFGDLDDIQRDQSGNYYISTWNLSPSVYRFDSAFTLPGEPICDGYGLMTDCYYNRQDNLLAVTFYEDNSYTFIQRVIVVDTDTSWGWVPFDVQFEGSSDFDIAEWSWDFGDGDTANSNAPSHTYTEPGTYELQLRAVTTEGDTLHRIIPNCIAALADTIWVDHVEVLPDSSLDVVIHANNNIALSRLDIPIEFSDGDLDLSATSVSFTTEGCRTEDLDYQSMVHMSPSNKQVTFRLRNTGASSDLPPGSGPVLKLHFEPGSTPQVGQSTTISVSGYGTRLPTFSGMLAEYMPVTSDGSITIVSCCKGFRGNVDGDELDEITIADLVFLVDYMFNDGSQPTCWEESNINGDIMGDYLGQVTIADLVYLVDYMFSGGPPPALCP